MTASFSESFTGYSEVHPKAVGICKPCSGSKKDSKVYQPFLNQGMHCDGVFIYSKITHNLLKICLFNHTGCFWGNFYNSFLESSTLKYII